MLVREARIICGLHHLFEGRTDDQPGCALQGQRDYLQSGDVFNALIAATGAQTDLALSFSKLIHEPVGAVLASEIQHAASTHARFRGIGPQGAIDLALIPSGKGPQPKRLPYDEESVVAKSIIEANTIYDNNKYSATAIERIVALNKKLVNIVLNPGRKLLFTSIKLSHLPEHPVLSLQIRSHAANRIFKSAIHADEKFIGDLIFYGV